MRENKIIVLFILITTVLVMNASKAEINQNYTFRQIDSVFNSTTNDSIQSACLLAKGNKFLYQLNNADSGLFYAQRLQQYPYFKAHVPYMQSKAYHIQGQYHQSIIALKHCIAMLEGTKNKKLLSKAYSFIGTNYRMTENMEEAMHNFNLALHLNLAIKDSLSYSSTLLNIGNLYLKKQEYEKALEIYLKCFEIRNKLHQTQDIYTVYLSMALAYGGVQMPDSARKYYRLAKEKTNNNPNKGIRLLINYASFEMEQKNHLEAEILFKSLIKDKHCINYPQAWSFANLGLAETYFNMGQYKKAIDPALKASAFLIKEGIDNELILAYKILAQSYNKLELYAPSIAYYQKWIEAKDRYHTKANNANFQALEAKYELNQKEQELVLLKIQEELTASKLKAKESQENYIMVAFTALCVVLLLLFWRVQTKQKANKKLQETGKIILNQKKALEFEQNRIKESINSAKDMQRFILKPQEELIQLFKDAFILYQPKDVVSGDFYWFFRGDNYTIVALADCTGHGVPGAFNSIFGFNILERVVKEFGVHRPDLVLKLVNRELSRTFKNNNDLKNNSLGMEMCVCTFYDKGNLVQMASSHTPIYKTANNEIHEFKGNRKSLGFAESLHEYDYTLSEVKWVKNEMFYMISDGFPDQKGGTKNKKFYYAPLKKVLSEVSSKGCTTQKNTLLSHFVTWKKDHPQTDDVSIIGIRV